MVVVVPPEAPVGAAAVSRTRPVLPRAADGALPGRAPTGEEGEVGAETLGAGATGGSCTCGTGTGSGATVGTGTGSEGDGTEGTDGSGTAGTCADAAAASSSISPTSSAPTPLRIVVQTVPFRDPRQTDRRGNI